jgi:hypothetical protein
MHDGGRMSSTESWLIARTLGLKSGLSLAHLVTLANYFISLGLI